MLDTHGIVVVTFSVVDKANQVRFLKKIFLVSNISPEVVFGMLFLILSCANVDFSSQELWWRTYTTEEVLPTTRRVKLVEKKKFAAAALDLKYETCIVPIVSLSFTPLVASLGSAFLDIYPSRSPQISSLIAKEAPVKVFAKYSDFADVFSPDLASKLPKYTGIKKHAIKLLNG